MNWAAQYLIKQAAEKQSARLLGHTADQLSNLLYRTPYWVDKRVSSWAGAGKLRDLADRLLRRSRLGPHLDLPMLNTPGLGKFFESRLSPLPFHLEPEVRKATVRANPSVRQAEGRVVD